MSHEDFKYVQMFYLFYSTFLTFLKYSIAFFSILNTNTYLKCFFKDLKNPKEAILLK